MAKSGAQIKKARISAVLKNLGAPIVSGESSEEMGRRVASLLSLKISTNKCCNQILVYVNERHPELLSGAPRRRLKTPLSEDAWWKVPPILRAYRPSTEEKREFYASWEWRTLRVKVLQKYGRICGCCGARPGQVAIGGNPVRIVVDHIQPLAKRWDLRLDISNLRVLCEECNQGKGAWDQSDYRAA